MNIETIIGQIAHIDHLLDSRRVTPALDALTNLTPSGAAAWQFNSELSRLREAYSLMSRYALDGVDDPGRGGVYDDIAESVRSLARMTLRARRMTDDSALYYAKARYESMQSGDTTASLLARADALGQLMSLSMLEGAGGEAVDKETGRPARLVSEDVAERIFNRVWTTYPLSGDDREAVASALTSETMPRHIRHLLVSALLAGELEFHDERRLLILMDTYGNRGYGDEELQLKALTALLIAMWVQRARGLKRRARARFDSLRELPTWERDVRAVYFELARARDTERINRKIKDELIPGLMKLRPDLEKRFGKGGSLSDVMGGEDNPEWAEMLDKSGISDKLKELSEIQQDGGDIMMATFNNLKSFPFFNDVSNWFLPFYADHSLVAMSQEPGFRAMAGVIADAPMLCDSDKYSLVCALKHMPQAGREMFLTQFNAQASEMTAAFRAETDSTTVRRRGYIAQYVRSLYRFFKLFRRKGEFLDFFSSPVNLASMELFNRTLGDVDTVRLMAEFYFKRGYYQEAFTLFERLTAISPASPEVFQKMGYCLQEAGDIEGALRYYSQSELLRADSLWTLRRLASCHRMLGHHREALGYYRRIAEKRPEDAAVAMSTGHCLLELGKPEEALKEYFKAEFLKPKSARTRRPIAWASLLAGDTDRASRYYEKILSDAPGAEDYLNAGHLEMIKRNYRTAISHYGRSLSMMEFDTAGFASSFGADIETLRRAGVDDFMTGIVLDSVLSASASSGSQLKRP